MSRVVAFLRRHALLGVACAVVLWPLIAVILDLVLTGSPVLAVFPLAVSAFVLWIVFGVRSLWRQRRRVFAALLACVLIAPHGVLYIWIAESFLQDWAKSRAVRSFHDRIAAEGRVLVSEVVSGWDTVCACTLDTEYAFSDCYVGYGSVRRNWQLKFYRHPDSKLRTENFFLEVPMPGLANISHDRTVCYSADQVPVIARDPLYDDLLTLMARPKAAGSAR